MINGLHKSKRALPKPVSEIRNLKNVNHELQNASYDAASPSEYKTTET